MFVHSTLGNVFTVFVYTVRRAAIYNPWTRPLHAVAHICNTAKSA